MRILSNKILLFLSILLTVTFNSCDDNATLDVPGPDIDFLFSFSDLRNASTGYQMVAQSDTIKGKDLESYLSGKGQDYSSVVEAATLKDALLTLSEGSTFVGVDSVQIRYQIAGTTEEVVLAQAIVTDPTARTLGFSNLKVNKSQAFELIKKDLVAKLYAAFNPFSVNCFQPGVTYRFTAKTVLTVNMSAITNGLIGAAN